MDFVKSLSMFHVDAKEIPCVTGEGTPTEKTEGAPGVLYMDTLTGALYKCRAADYVNGVFTWEAVEAGGSSDEAIALTDNVGLKIGPEGQMLSHEGSTNHIISQSIPVSAGERYRLTCSANFRNSLYAIYSGEADKANLLENLIAESTEGGSKIIAQEVVMPTGAKCMIVAWNKLVTDTPYAVVRVSQSAQTTLPLARQTVVVIGDSIVERNNKTSVNFCDHLTVNTGAEIVNMGVGGTGYMAGQDEGQAFYQRAAEIPDGVDRVLIYGSGNDRNMTLGEPTDTGTETLCGCVNATLDVVFDRAPTAWVGVIAPAPWKDYPPFEEGNAMEEIAGALAAICRRRGVPYLDLYHSSGLRPWDEAFRTLAYSKDGGDGTHPDETGHAMIAPQIQAFLLGAVGSMVDTSDSIPIGGENLGGVKNGGNVVINADGTMDAPNHLGIAGAAVGQIARITAVDNKGVPAAWEAVDEPKTPHIGENGNWWIGETDTGVSAGGNGSSPYRAILSGSVDDDINMIEFTGLDNYSEFLFIGELKGGNASGVFFYINGNLVGGVWGSYFVHNHDKLNITHIKIDRERRIYRFESDSPQLNSMYNQDSVTSGAWRQTLTGDNPITSLGFKLNADKYFKAGSTYTLWGR